jgi:hypothetical protein
MVRNRTDSSRAQRISHLQETAQELSLQIEDAQNWHELLLHRLVHGRDGVWAALRYTSLQHSSTLQQTTTSAIMPGIPHHSSSVTEKFCSWDVEQKESPSEQEETSGKVLETESATDTDTAEPRRKGHTTHHQGTSPKISVDDFSNMDMSSKRDRVRQGIVLQEDKIRSILSGMKERMVTVDKENESESDIDSHSI